MRKCIADIGAGAGFLALGAAFGLQLSELTGVSRIFPQALVIVVALGGVYFILKGGVALLRERAANASADASADADASERISWPRVGLMSALAVGYALVVKTLGFFASTALFLFLSFMVLGDRSASVPRRVLFGVLFAGGFCFFIWGGFVKLLNVPTPVGILP